MPLIVLDPTSESVPSTARMAPALRSLAGATVGLLDNGKANVTPFLDHVEMVLRTAHGVRDVVRRRKANMSAPAAPEQLRELVACDAVVSAVGD
ncbi:MAG: hypothetical protein E6J70_11680 [Deltaproteobacteria bacterium]|nr:MAG: hypothetical protein E6J70_11680 [Deltaproteobacteria bacterium]